MYLIGLLRGLTEVLLNLEAKYILGIELKRDRQAQTISLSQSQYIRTVLELSRP